MTILTHRRILLVEDDYLQAAELHDHLAELQATVLGPARCISQARHLLAPMPDAAILDVGLDGDINALIDLPLDFRSSGKAVLLCTGYSACDLPPPLGAFPICVKPAPVRLVAAYLARVMAEVSCGGRQDKVFPISVMSSPEGEADHRKQGEDQHARPLPSS